MVWEREKRRKGGMKDGRGRKEEGKGGGGCG